MFGIKKKETKKSDIAKPSFETLVIPECKVTECQMPTINDKHNSFDLICSSKELNNEKFRVKSSNSTEVFRLYCEGDTYEFKYDSRICDGSYCEFKYPISNEKYAFIVRYFLTNSSKRYFAQIIRRDESAIIRLVPNVCKIQNVIESAESSNGIYNITSSESKNSVLPGTYFKIDDIRYKLIRDQERIVKLEVIDKELYSQIVKEY